MVYECFIAWFQNRSQSCPVTPSKSPLASEFLPGCDVVEGVHYVQPKPIRLSNRLMQRFLFSSAFRFSVVLNVF